MKILITGGSGFLGQYLNIKLAKHHKILTLYHQVPRNCKDFDSEQIDIREYDKLNHIFSSFKPEIVLHAASISTPQKADTFPNKIVYATNVTSTENLAKLCEKYSSKLIYTSTDLVYAGYRGSYLKEDAKLIPISVYAETKLMGEEKIKSTFDNYVILRTALMYGFGFNGTSCFYHQMHDKMLAGQKVKVFYDQFRSPLSVLEAAWAINFLCESGVKGETLNFGGIERLSRYDLGLMLCKAANLNEELLEKISMNDLPNYPHVVDVSMNIEKLKLFGISLKNTDEAIIETLENKLV